MHATIRQKYTVFFHLIFLFCTTIRPKIKVHTDLFLYMYTTIRPKVRFFNQFIYFICTRPFDKKLGSSLIYFFRLHTTNRQKYMIFFLSFIHFLCTTIRPKDRVFINLVFLFVHDHSTKLGVTLTLLFILFLGVPIFHLLYSWQILPLHFIHYVHNSTTYFFRSVQYIHWRAVLIFRTLYPWLYEVLAMVFYFEDVSQ